jgi:mannose-6-phosphate isomerase-like protein (cupin superfamily)
MSSPAFATKRLGGPPDAIAPDGSDVRVLCATGRGGMALFTLAPGAVARPVAHRTVEELWYVIAGAGRLWRRLGERQEVTDLAPGTSIAIPTGAHFQFRCDGEVPLQIVAATLPPWPGDGEAYPVPGKWQPTVGG